MADQRCAAPGTPGPARASERESERRAPVAALSKRSSCAPFEMWADCPSRGQFTITFRLQRLRSGCSSAAPGRSPPLPCCRQPRPPWQDARAHPRWPTRRRRYPYFRRCVRQVISPHAPYEYAPRAAACTRQPEGERRWQRRRRCTLPIQLVLRRSSLGVAAPAQSISTRDSTTRPQHSH